MLKLSQLSDQLFPPLDFPLPRGSDLIPFRLNGRDLGLELRELTGLFRETGVQVFTDVVGKGGVIRGIVVPNATLSRKELDDAIFCGDEVAIGQRIRSFPLKNHNMRLA